MTSDNQRNADAIYFGMPAQTPRLNYAQHSNFTEPRSYRMSLDYLLNNDPTNSAFSQQRLSSSTLQALEYLDQALGHYSYVYVYQRYDQRHSQPPRHNYHPYGNAQAQRLTRTSESSDLGSNYPQRHYQGANIMRVTKLNKRPRRKYHEVERPYHCSRPGCVKSYSAINHLNKHISDLNHGPRKVASDFYHITRKGL